MRNDKENIIVAKSFSFALKIIDFSNKIETAKKYSLDSQIFRSGTSIGANIREAQNAESKADFIHKMKIAAKEADELEYWLLLCKEYPHLISPTSDLFEELTSIISILTKIIATSKKS
ncbi:four helix bundle protein [Elizabethkingia ursingii]|uniref:Four helix bundle protein n=1 Tax=Elizabethkingia ursingii TaxID=1756150 RepID=A0AAJ3NG66_9FLAO|nr:four helix bundle protein [Elizabethkingia ursingii]AQX10480.1 four helix bundle protein [Elizabethkingia ursingii]OPB80613.1 four helix bundle protein [Elizabethkingia ursingii]